MGPEMALSPVTTLTASETPPNTLRLKPKVSVPQVRAPAINAATSPWVPASGSHVLGAGALRPRRGEKASNTTRSPQGAGA